MHKLNERILLKTGSENNAYYIYNVRKIMHITYVMLSLKNALNNQVHYMGTRIWYVGRTHDGFNALII